MESTVLPFHEDQGTGVGTLMSSKTSKRRMAPGPSISRRDSKEYFKVRVTTVYGSKVQEVEIPGARTVPVGKSEVIALALSSSSSCTMLLIFLVLL